MSGVFATGLLAAATTGQAIKTFDQLVGSYNLISLGDAKLTSYGDTEGGIAVGGKLTIDGGVIAAHPEKTGQPGTFAALYVKGALNYTGAGSTIKMQSGHAALPGIGSGNQWNSANKILRQGSTQILSQINSPDVLAGTDPRSAILDPAWDFNSLHNSFRDISDTFAAATPNGQISVIGQNLTFTANPGITHGAIVFDFDASLLSGAYYNGKMISSISIDVPESSVFVINVLNANGRTLFGSGINFNYDDSYVRLLWNIVDGGGDPTTQTITFGNGGQFYGSVLAPDYMVKNGLNTAINGQVVAGAFQYSGAELHYTGFDIPGVFDTELPPAPEPSTYGLVGAGALMGLVFWRRHKASKAAKQQ